MQASHSVGAVSVRFDDPNLVSCAGLVPVLRLAEQVGVADLAEQTVKLSPDVGSAGANPGVKVSSIVAGMACGADSFEDLGVIRHGGMSRLFDGIRAPSTLGTFLRGFTYGHVAQLEKLGRIVLERLAGRCGLLPGADELVFVDIDSKIKEVYGAGKQGSAYGYTKVRGLNYLMATISTPGTAPVVAATRMRGGNANSARGAASLITSAIKTARACGATGTIVVRGDSAFFTGPVIAAIRKAGAYFSVTAKHTATVKAAIAGIDENTWQTVRFNRPVFDDRAKQWIYEGEIAETTLEAFTNVTQNPGRAVTARLIVRRTRITTTDATGELFPVWLYHAIFTDSPHELLTAEAEHRGRAGTIEQVFADLNDSAAAHLPSGQLAANGAWLSLAALTHNLMRAAGSLASQFHAKARTTTLRRHLITIPARIARSARRIVLHLPADWHWKQAFTSLFTATHPPPAGACP
ncbi:IS1380 family transposase [Saccharopolyspora pogona]|uniref:IS1380 family transposase n=1 Tax=Saccharopolyspora pogona TaxID=333966 RepID=UPI0016827DDF|nr:IS1380 family transposase [Saccharopolyspora pogona]